MLSWFWLLSYWKWFEGNYYVVHGMTWITTSNLYTWEKLFSLGWMVTASVIWSRTMLNCGFFFAWNWKLLLFFDFFFGLFNFDQTDRQFHGSVNSIFILNVSWFGFMVKEIRLIRSIKFLIEPTVCSALDLTTLNKGLDENETSTWFTHHVVLPLGLLSIMYIVSFHSYSWFRY